MLIFLLIIPLLGSLFCWIFGRQYYKFARFFALSTVICLLVLSGLIWFKYFYHYNLQLYHTYWNDELIIPWIPQLGIDLHLAIDGLSFMMVVLTSILGVVAILCSFYEKKQNEGLFYFNLLFMMFGTIGVLLSIDLFLFFCFWEIMIIPMYFLIIFWGHPKYTKKQKIYTANQFLIYTQISSMIMLFSILLLSYNYYYQTNIWTFDYNRFINYSIPLPLEYIIMLGFFVAFAVKMPIVPFHGWLLNCHSQSSVDGSFDLLGMLIKVSAYGLLRFNMHLFKNSSNHFYFVIITLGIVTIFYGAWMAFCEVNIKKIIAYSSISHMGFILITIYCNNVFAYYGAIIQIIFGSFTTSAIFVLLSQLYRCTKTNIITQMGGLYSHVNWIPSFFLFFLFANLNLPGTINFVGEVMALTGIFIYEPYIGCILVFSLFFSVIYSLNIVHKMFYGPVKNNDSMDFRQINCVEFFIIFLFIVITLILGIYPNNILQIVKFSIE
ncbi:NADH-quinone oxidoreductase subunit M [Buchnera aphidicola (Takecallis arundicolens)]|uniref:complex I subunit 4 family protein n=1 Tax=Buchnera aphidicola TaxID=9 RepID=UPI003463A9E5